MKLERVFHIFKQGAQRIRSMVRTRHSLKQELLHWKQLATNLQADQEELTDFIENAALPLHWVDKDGTIVWVNQAELDLLGYTREEYLGRPIAQFHADPPVIDDILERLNNNELLHNYEARLQAKDGSIKHVLITSNVYRRNGEFIHTRCFTRDITERVDAEISVQRLAAVVASSNDPIYSKDLKGIITSWNAAAESMYGYTATEAIGQHISILVPQENHAELTDILKRLSRGEHISHFETVRIAKDGKAIETSLTLSPIHNTAGKIIGISSIARDISERKALEQEREAVLRLERQARLEAEKADQLKLQFLAMISHELRTPLTSIKGFSTTLLAPDVEWTREQYSDFLQIIDQEADKLTELIDQLLDIARMQSGTLRIVPEVQPVKQLMGILLPQLERMVGNRPFTFHVADKLPNIRIDQQRIVQVFSNLVENAIKYSPEGTPIEVHVMQQSGCIQVDIIDEGGGIPPAERERVFEAFQQLERKEEARGAGLGLAICKVVIEAHGGQIWVQDKTSPGTMISFTLPIIVD